MTEADATDRPHRPVMLDEVLAHLAPRAGEVLVDGTFGAGGYTSAILASGAEVVAIDRDPTAIAAGAAMVAAADGRLRLVEGAFGDLDEHLASLGLDAVDGVVLDIGVSSMQLDRAERGFSFRADGPLDMRMAIAGETAADVVNTADVGTLAHIFRVYGEEKRAGSVARAIVEARAKAPFVTTGQLVEVVQTVIWAKPHEIHPATRVFQALRIHVNDELGELVRALAAAERALKPGGRLVVVTFHSLEDRIVKRFFADRCRSEAGGSRHAPRVTVAPATFEAASDGAEAASEGEIADNPRARSAKLRAGRRTAAPARDVDAAALGLPRVDPMKRGGR
ncbi:16S rRNA (cytosine(1402)-N(4))-methyltransferase RsmH [Siculibacillus lacustris]|uniref:Ribosomal RNA small subunit methyltransferase H n=1 Tax=Siculibacillus lacustris TaxID=1549641 RepID=A0A4Q9VSS7_9HYPH|nr:16S rRNA (cytosine(1402)-N(4))-methyltransferase RsmH [Siculibacillus lacustris]TBW38716.1 16S rRNA (cytosine(1402)-N(4))-methyltransferase RsmH [Siculibacillus lacustris]